MTTLGNVSLKLRKNGGAATTYTNVSSPAITQSSDATFVYALEIAANTYADGDRLEWVWLYSSVVQAAGSDVVGPTSVDGAHYTVARGDKLDDLDATISSRLATSGYTAPDNTSVTAIKAKTDLIPAAGPPDAAHYTNARGDNLANLDVAVSTRLATSGYTAPDNTDIAAIKVKTDLIPAAGPPDAAHYTNARGDLLSNLDAAVSTRSTYAGGDTAGTTTLLGRLTSTRAGYLDNLTNLDATISGIATAVWAAATRTLTAASDSSGVTTLLSRLSSGRATNLDNLDATVSSRLATSGYTAPDNADVVAIKAKTDNLPASPAAVSDIPTAATIAATVWNYLTSSISTVGSIGKLLKDNVNATISSRSTYAGTDTSGTTTLLGRLTGQRATNLDNLDAPVSGVAAGVAGAVWDETLADHLSSGSTGAALQTTESLGNPWAVELPDTYTGAQAGAILPSIKAKTDLFTVETHATLTAPMIASGGVYLVQGDDYFAADGRALSWTNASWPTLEGSSVEMFILNVNTDAVISVNGAAMSADEVQVEIPSSVTTDLAAGKYRYAVKATLADDNIMTLVAGHLTVTIQPIPS